MWGESHRSLRVIELSRISASLAPHARASESRVHGDGRVLRWVGFEGRREFGSRGFPLDLVLRDLLNGSLLPGRGLVLGSCWARAGLGSRSTRSSAVAPPASEWIHQAALAIRAAIPIDLLLDQVAQFPTHSEGYLAALEELRKRGRLLSR